MAKKVVITAALPYANGEIHLGHIVSTYLPADILTRFFKLDGADALYICASDDYGTPILIKAEQEGKTPEEFVNFWNEKAKRDFAAANIDFDIYYHTHSPENRELTQHFFRVLYDKGFVYEQKISQPFCPKCQKFLPDRYLKGTCPNCGAPEQYSDGCEKCGRVLSQGEMKQLHCAVCGTSPETRESIHFFFRLSKMSQQLKQWLEENKNLQPEVTNYVLNWIKEGLIDWDITRDISWGVPIPLAEAKGKVFYGWFDNHLGYISTTLKVLKDRGEPDPKAFWNDATIFHFIGKDIVYHHLLFLPAMRMGVAEYKLPDFVPTRGHLTIGGQKFSKSRGNYIGLQEFLEKFPADHLRYYLSAITPYSMADVNFDWKEFQARSNNELVATLGNFVHRTLHFLYTQYDGVVPEATLNEADKELLAKVHTSTNKAHDLLEKVELMRGLQEIMKLVAEGNTYFQQNAPWKATPERKAAVIYVSVNLCRSLAVLLWPYLPTASEKLWRQLNLEGSPLEAGWASAEKPLVKSGHKINKPEILFRKIEDEELTLKEAQKEVKTMETIPFGEFKKLDLRVATIRAAEPVPNSNKLVKLTIDLGETRTLVAGIGKKYKPEELVGKQIIVVANLQPAVFKGITSQGMLLAAFTTDESELALLTPDKPMAPGTQVG